MKCFFCNRLVTGIMTVRVSGDLYNCCRNCYEADREDKGKMTISYIKKDDIKSV